MFYGDFVQRSELACGERVWEIIVANGEREGFQQQCEWVCGVVLL